MLGCYFCETWMGEQIISKNVHFLWICSEVTASAAGNVMYFIGEKEKHNCKKKCLSSICHFKKYRFLIGTNASVKRANCTKGEKMNNVYFR